MKAAQLAGDTLARQPSPIIQYFLSIFIQQLSDQTTGLIPWKTRNTAAVIMSLIFLVLDRTFSGELELDYRLLIKGKMSGELLSYCAQSIPVQRAKYSCGGLSVTLLICGGTWIRKPSCLNEDRTGWKDTACLARDLQTETEITSSSQF